MTPLLIQAAIPTFNCCLSLFLTEPPVWLLSQGRSDDARQDLDRLRADNPSLIHKELAETAAAPITLWSEAKDQFLGNMREQHL